MVRRARPALTRTAAALTRTATALTRTAAALTRTAAAALSRLGDAFRSPLRSPRLASLLGVALAVCFGVCFATGLLSHLIQYPPGWFRWPARPVHLYRVTQGLHVATGLAGIPLLAAKLWSVYPKLFSWPPVRDLPHALERFSIAVLNCAALFQLVSGLLNISLWYTAMPFFFPVAHYWTAWLAVGAIVTHVGVKLPVVRATLARVPVVPDPPDPPAATGLTRRGLLMSVAGAVGLVTIATAGQTSAPLRALSPLAPRRPDLGPQGLPVNKSASAAGVHAAIADPGYRLVVVGPGGTLALTLAELQAMPQHLAHLPIACVEGWSADAVWQGVRLRDLVVRVDGDPDAGPVRVESLQRGGRYRASDLAPAHVRDPLTLLALRLNGAPLHPDHGYPCRLIAANLPGVRQTKWVGRLTIGAPR